MYLGENIRKLGFGLMRLPMIGEAVDIEQTRQMVDLFMERGFTYFDTAYGYINGKSEEAARETLVDRYARDRYQLATKLPAWFVSTPEEAREMLWTSLRRTGVEFFDFYLLHNLGVGRTEVFEEYGIWDFLVEQKKEGRIRHLGFSLHATADRLQEILERHHEETEFVQLQINYADWENGIVQSRRCYEVARKFGKPVVVMEPLKGGGLTKLPKRAARVLDTADPGASQASWGLRYAASLEGIVTVLSGMSTLEQMQDNVACMEAFQPLSDKELAVIGEVQEILAEIPQVPCTDCRYCLAKCPKDIAIPGIFKTMNDYLVCRDLKTASFVYGFETRTMGKASECVRCGNCEAVCPQSIPIIEELSKAAKAFEG